MTALTALEIFTNPDDLAFKIAREKEDEGKFSFGIFRGPGHNFKLMLSTTAFAESLEEVLKAVKEVLDTAVSYVTGEFKNGTSVAARVLNPEGLEIDESKVMNTTLIERIISDLREKKEASTYTTANAAVAG